MDSKTSLKDRYTDLYNRSIDRIEARSASYLNSFRREAIGKFSTLGVPDKKNEAYKYTSLDYFFGHDYKSYFMPDADDFRQAEQFDCDVKEMDVHNFVLLNGFYPTHNGKIKKLPSGVVVGSLNEAAIVYPEMVEKHYGRYALSDNDGLIHLNTAMASDGMFLFIPKGKVLDKPVQIVNLVNSAEDIFVQHRNLIVVEDNAEAVIIICDHTLSPMKFLTNAVTEIFVGENARFSIVRVQNEHNNAAKLTHTFIHQSRGSYAYSNNIALHGGLVRNSTYHTLAGEGAETMSAGLYLTDKSQHVDNFVSVDHVFPNCTSNQVFKGVLDDVATGAFNGRILVRRNSQGTRAYQSNNTILLTDAARMDTKPQLEIFADDVKCSHGATVGQLDEDALFYLTSRGINRREARLMLMFGFAHEVVKDIPVEALRDRIDTLVMERLRGELSRCASCMVRCGQN